MIDFFSYKMLLVFFTGLVAGFINIFAGGGSLLTLPALIFLGLPAGVANGTNRIALLVGGVTGVFKFKSKGYFEPVLGFKLAVPAVLGSFTGALIAIKLSDTTFKIIFSVVIILSFFTILLRSKKINKDETNAKDEQGKIFFKIIVFFLIGFYGGLIQAGVGLVLMSVLSYLLSGSLVRINSIKNFIIVVFLVVSVIVFIAGSKIHIVTGIVLSIGNVIGTYIATHISVKGGEKWIRVILMILLPFMAAGLIVSIIPI